MGKASGINGVLTTLCLRPQLLALRPQLLAVNPLKVVCVKHKELRTYALCFRDPDPLFVNRSESKEYRSGITKQRQNRVLTTLWLRRQLFSFKSLKSNYLFEDRDSTQHGQTVYERPGCISRQAFNQSIRQRRNSECIEDTSENIFLQVCTVCPGSSDPT